MGGDTRDGWNATIDRVAHSSAIATQHICQSNPHVT